MKRLVLSLVLLFAFVPILAESYVIPIDTRANDVRLVITDAGSGASFHWRFVRAEGQGLQLGGVVGTPEPVFEGDADHGRAVMSKYQTAERFVRKDFDPELQSFLGALVIESDGPLVVKAEEVKESRLIGIW